MFDLRDLPDLPTLEDFRARYPDLDISALQVALRLARLGEDIARHLDKALVREGLSLRRLFVLVLLARTPGGLRATQLSRGMGVTKATVSEVLAGMERADLIATAPDPEDARAQLAVLTPTGRQLLDAVLPGHYRRVAALLQDVSEVERALTLRLLGCIEARIP